MNEPHVACVTDYSVDPAGTVHKYLVLKSGQRIRIVVDTMGCAQLAHELGLPVRQYVASDFNNGEWVPST